MKTIFITSFHPFISKNILNTDVFKILRTKSDLKIVLLVPQIKEDFFQANYASDNVTVEGIDLAPFSNSRSNSFFSKAAFFFIYSQWIRYKKRPDYFKAHPRFYSFFKFYTRLTLTRILSANKSLRAIFRFFDRHFSPNNFYKTKFDKYRPDAVFSADIYTDFDQALIKEAKMHGVFSIGMVRSWDNNYSKGLCRVLPDKLIVNNEIIKKEAIELHDFKGENIFVGGLPQFDNYLKAPFESREEFFSKAGGDPKKRTILFAPGSHKDAAEANVLICRALKAAKKKGILPMDIQFFVRQHPHRVDSALDEFKDDPDFIVETPGTWFEGNQKYTEFSPEDNIRLIDTVYYSDIVIWIVTSIGLDSLVFDKPQIAVHFDGLEPKPYWLSIRRMNDEEHMKVFFKTGGIYLAGNINALISRTDEYLKNPKLDEEGRKKAALEQLWKVDGKSGERIANFILSILF